MFRITMFLLASLVVTHCLTANPYGPEITFAPAKFGQQPTCASEDLTYCEFVDDYPLETIINLINKRRELLKENNVFDEDFDSDNEYDPISDFNIRTNISIGKSWDEDGCKTITKFIWPRVARNLRGDWRYVVNVPSIKSQPVKVERCANTKCSAQIRTKDMKHIEPKCFEVFLPKELIALHPSGRLVREQFPMRSCCQCNLVYH